MTILVTGSTGTIGSQVLAHLGRSDAAVRALTRSPEKANLPSGIVPVKGEVSDIESMRKALAGVSTLFLLLPGVADELTQALITLNLAREAGVRGIVYLSVLKGESYVDVPHFTSKHTTERMIEHENLPATVLRPAYFTQNDLRQKDALLTHGIYGMPIGAKGISMVDIRDIGEAASLELIRRERADAPLPHEAYPLVGPDVLNGEALAAIWSEALGRSIRYGGDDLDVMEQRLKAFVPGWHAYDLKLMFRRYQTDGAAATVADLRRLTGLLGRTPRSYRDFAKEAAAQWAKS
jgi:uncharacterized protein YbjT (DUF2867 family)